MRKSWTITTPSALANALKAFRHDRKMTQKDVAEAIGIRQATVSLFESHPEQVKIETLFKILSALNTHIPIERREANQDNWKEGL